MKQVFRSKIHLLEGAIRPTYATPGSSCLDVYSNDEGTIKPGTRKVINLGFHLELERFSEAQIRPRSGNSAKGIDITLGTIDSDYRGEIKVTVINNSLTDFKYNRDKAIAQMAICSIAKGIFYDADLEDLSKTERGTGGFGHTDDKDKPKATNKTK